MIEIMVVTSQAVEERLEGRWGYTTGGSFDVAGPRGSCNTLQVSVLVDWKNDGTTQAVQTEEKIWGKKLLISVLDTLS